ncbi:hypothetical protein Gohar_009322, partial [Gossypium harknessii]|nr:hypothetical protein [Gossypium harknessii]
MSLVGLESMCQSRSYGGLGMRIKESISENIVLGRSSFLSRSLSKDLVLLLLRVLCEMKVGTEFLGTIAIWGSVQLLTLNYGAFWMVSTSSKKEDMTRRIQYLLTEEGQWLVRHIPQEHNQPMDIIAKQAFGSKEDLQTLDSPLRGIQEILDMDRIKNF